MAVDQKLFGRHLRRWRTEAGFEQRELARRTSISPSYVSFIEKGKRSPSLAVVLAVAGALGLTSEKRDSLLRAAGYQPIINDPLSDPLNRIYNAVAHDALTMEERDRLLKAMEEFIANWRSLEEKRKQKVRKAVMVAAGWQPRLLSTESLERTLFHAAQEVVNAGIPQLIAVLARDTPDSSLENLRRRLNNLQRREISLSRVVQEQPLGLGDAILAARQQIGDEPFAVILPDDIDPSRGTLKKMTELYKKKHAPIIAVNPGQIRSQHPETRYHGIATLEERPGKTDRLRCVLDLREKPPGVGKLSSNTRMVVGRYILTPEIWGELQALRPNRRTGKQELTDALAAVLRSQTVFAFELERPMLPLDPVRSVIERLVHSINDRARFEEVLRLTEKLLREIEAI